MGNLGGHDLPSLVDAFEAARQHDRPVCFIAYTIKGFGLPLAGHKDNHAGLMTPAQVEDLRARHHVRPGHEWDQFEGLTTDAGKLDAFIKAAPFNAEGTRRHQAPHIAVPADARRAASAGHVDPAGLRPAAQRDRQEARASSPAASSPPRRTSPSPPISAPG